MLQKVPLFSVKAAAGSTTSASEAPVGKEHIVSNPGDRAGDRLLGPFDWGGASQ